MTVDRSSLKKMTRIISWLDRYSEYRLKNPMFIKSEVTDTGEDYVKAEWRRIEGDVERVYAAFLPYEKWATLTDILRPLCIGGILIAALPTAAGFLIHLVPSTLRTNLQDFFAVMYSDLVFPFFIAVVSSIALCLIGDYIVRKKIDDLHEKHSEEFKRINDGVQRLIFHLTAQIQDLKEDPNNYRMDLYSPNHRGIRIIIPPQHFGKTCYVAIPSAIDAILSGAKESIGIFDPALSTDSFQSLIKIPLNVSVRVLTSSVEGQEKHFLGFIQKL